MFEWIGKFIPPEIGGPIVLAGLLWAGAHYLFIGPEVGERLGTLKWQAQCDDAVAGFQEDNRKRRTEERELALVKREDILRQAREEVRRARQEAAHLQSLARGIFPKELGNLFDAITGQPGFRDRIARSIPIPEMPDISELDLPKVPDLLPNASAKERKGFCGCVVQKSLERSRVDLALYTGSLRAFTPMSIANFGGTMADTATSDICGRAPS